MGDVTVRNGVEFPARTVTETATELMLPPGYVPVAVTLKAGATAAATLDVAIVDVNSGEAADVDESMWFAMKETSS